MNIAAYRAACEAWDLDSRAKHALQAICAHVPRPPTTTVKLRIDQLAIDMGVSYTTAYRALRRLKASGYVAVVYGPSKSLIVTLNPERLGERIGADAHSDLGAHAYSVPAPTPKRIGAGAGTKGVFGEKQEADVAPTNGSAPPAPHGADCECKGEGLVERTLEDGRRVLVVCPAPREAKR